MEYAIWKQKYTDSDSMKQSFLEKQRVAELVQKSPASYGIRCTLRKPVKSSNTFISYLFKVHDIIYPPTPRWSLPSISKLKYTQTQQQVKVYACEQVHVRNV
jgi:hypothetical protein